VAVNVNDEVGPYFQTKKGLRQGDPLSPILFNIVADMLAILINRAKVDGQISGVVPHLVLGLKINFHKSETFCFGAAQQNLTAYMQLFGCNSGDLPIRYLGIPIHYRRLPNTDWRKVDECFEKRLSNWKSKHFSTGGRLTLINSVLSSLSMYMVLFFAIPKGVLKKLDYFRSSMKVKHDFLRFGTFLIKNGSQVRFWEDRWLGQLNVREQYLCLYNIARYKQATVAAVLGTSLPNISDLIGNKLAVWNNLLPRLANVVLCQDDNIFQCNLHPNGKFSIKSYYLALIHTDVPNINKPLWSLKAP
ncbi:LOW QUALITY PROTEIN: hypothetical protein U9M48_042582, partial [Paspalum notatum var. saurae]